MMPTKKHKHRLPLRISYTLKRHGEKSCWLHWNTYPDKPVLRLVLLGSVKAVIDKPKSSGLATSKLGAETKNKDSLGITHFVNLGELLLQLSLHCILNIQMTALFLESILQRTNNQNLVSEGKEDHFDIRRNMSWTLKSTLQHIYKSQLNPKLEKCRHNLTTSFTTPSPYKAVTSCLTHDIIYWYL